MQNELNDSLLSAYLDDQLTGEERAAVEAQLRESAEHRQTLAELQQLRDSFQALPRYELGDDFSGRVMQAALTAAQKETQQQNTAIESARTPIAPATTPVERAPASRTNRRLVYVVGAVAAVAACLLVIVQLGGGLGDGPVAEGPGKNGGSSVVSTEPEVSPESSAVAVLRQSLPGEGEALIIRVRVPAGTKPADALDAAIAQSGIRQLTPSEPTSAGRVGAAYRTAMREQAAPGAAAGESADDALYVEAPLGLVEDALAVLADQKGGKLELRPEMMVAVAAADGDRSGGEGEGESGSAAEQAASKEPFAQRLNPRMFRLPEEAAETGDAKATNGANVDPNRKVRVLILVETVEK